MAKNISSGQLTERGNVDDKSKQTKKEAAKHFPQFHHKKIRDHHDYFNGLTELIY